MNMKELLDFIKQENARLQAHFPLSDNEKRDYARMVKINEEVGELCNEVLALHGRQRKDKLNNNKENLSEEIADVLIATLLLAEQLDLNIEELLQRKIEKIKNRVY